MSIFDELNEQYAQFDAALTLQHQLLTKSVGDLAVGYEKYLGITVKNWFNADGTIGGRYIRLGTGSPERFEEKSWFQLTSSDGVVDFSIAITLESEDSAYPRFVFVFEGQAKFVNEGYEFSFKGIPYTILVGAAEVKSQDLSPVYDALTMALRSKLDLSSITIRQ